MTTTLLLIAAASLFGAVPLGQQASKQFRPPAVPLVTHDPYFSVWSTTDSLNGGVTRHWTGKEHPIWSSIQIDGKPFTLMGAPIEGIPALPQKSVVVLPTRTIYKFANTSFEVDLTFCSPLLMDDLDVLSRPATYVTYSVRSLDGKSHEASVFLAASGRLATNGASELVNYGPNWIGSVSQDVLGKSGDDLRIDWGRIYLATPDGSVTNKLVAHINGAEGALSLPNSNQGLSSPIEASSISLATDLAFGSVGNMPVSKHAILAYDDEYSIQFFGQNLRPWWKRNGMSSDEMLDRAESEYASIVKKCEEFDAKLMADLKAAGGEEYAQIGALAYRQSLAAQKVVADKNGQPLMFSKENFSNGCIGTVDVLYPAAPQLLLFSPTLTKASLVPILEYAASPRWKWPFAPHDLGTYPLANGQVYGGGELTEDNQMPVEESGNMLILLAALARIEDSAKFSEKYWPQLSKWAAYLADKGFDPENQLCTDDFAGHLAHNVNLSAKAIEALRAYAYLAQELGKDDEAKKYRDLASSFAQRWIVEAKDGDHTKLAFDKPGTWSQKYNLVWDKILDFNMFPSSVFQSEIAHYKTKLNPYGLPLDSRRDYTKLDWIVWTATMADSQKDFEALVDPILKFMNDSPDRAPMPDWYQTLQPRKEGFQARSVVGGVFIKLLADQATWRKWASRDKNKVGNWAPIPKPPVITEIVPTSQKAGLEWSYSTEKPTGDWFVESYAASGWKKGLAGFGTEGTPGAVVRTKWDSADIWIRRSFDLTADFDFSKLSLFIHHDEDAEVYVNDVLIAKLGGYTAQYQPKKMIANALRPGKNVIAIHCHQTGGGQYIDAGFATVAQPD